MRGNVVYGTAARWSQMISCSTGEIKCHTPYTRCVVLFMYSVSVETPCQGVSTILQAGSGCSLLTLMEYHRQPGRGK
jgi:hypothetical protein